MARGWVPADAWVLGALGGTGADSAASLGDVIAITDAAERLIIEESEFTRSAGRLIAAELMSTDGAAFWLTAAGREFSSTCGPRRESLLKGLRRLGDPPDAEPLVLPPGDFDRAADEYSGGR